MSTPKRRKPLCTLLRGSPAITSGFTSSLLVMANVRGPRVLAVPCHGPRCVSSFAAPVPLPGLGKSADLALQLRRARSKLLLATQQQRRTPESAARDLHLRRRP
ncbi:hypothetical protein E2562_003165 [Oryza meyeriana var. granulata]|uniref:Uncharacterized protein n=1 Tax=Oryza meyeriana var. granulata TaxID=110450 RepID=A0A6G1EUJ8_9ORYZ|nr:hypothetical protein E2562_003165 [Oryza meyeriana var. granulata]